MKKLKKKNIVIAVFVILILVFGGLAFAVQKAFNENVKKEFNVVDKSGKNLPEGQKDRLNVLVLGMEHTRTDMIMVATFDPKGKTLNMISIPRDTYVENSYRDGTLKKINSVYEMPSTKGGVERLAEKVSEILGIPIHDYVMVDYNAVAKITDAVGGVEVNIPFNMYYDDPYSDPPLHVHFSKGNVYLDGSNAIEYLRWRHNNDGSHGEEGDEGRVKRQQNFMKKILEKSLNPTTLPKIIEVAFASVETSLDLSQVMGLVADAASMPKENIHFYQEVGTPSYFNQLWYYLADIDKTQALMQKIINNSIITDEDLNPSKEFEAAALRRGNDSGYVRSYNSNEESEDNAPASTKKTVESTQLKTDDVLFENEQKNEANQQNQNTNANTDVQPPVTDESINNSVVDDTNKTTGETQGQTENTNQQTETTNNQEPVQPTTPDPSSTEGSDNSSGNESPIF